MLQACGRSALVSSFKHTGEIRRKRVSLEFNGAYQCNEQAAQNIEHLDLRARQ